SHPASLVTFVIGAKGKTKIFLMHKEVACAISTVLDRAFNSMFVEGRTQSYRLDDTNEKVFTYFMQFCYSGKVKFQEHDEGSEDHPVKCGLEMSTLLKLWVLGDKFLVGRLQNHVAERISEIARTCGPSAFASSLHYLYENTLQESELRRLVV
ncbi:hypothetical protein B0O99DRAFT_479415, partial [Bisporella sp. PMI_857]